MGTYSITHVDAAARTELHDTLGLTGAEVSINNLPAGGSAPFVHAHEKNEEIYGVLSGSGRLVIDGETVELSAGDWVHIAPEGRRQFFAAENEGIAYVCVQVRAGSLEEYAAEDALV